MLSMQRLCERTPTQNRRESFRHFLPITLFLLGSWRLIRGRVRNRDFGIFDVTHANILIYQLNLSAMQAKATSPSTRPAQNNHLPWTNDTLRRLMSQQYIPDFQKQMKRSILHNKKSSLTSSRSMATLMESYYTSVEKQKSPP